MKKHLFIFWALIPGLVFGQSLAQPKLIVQIVVDQLRGDMLNIHRSKFSPDGFNYLLQHSINYTNTHHPHANTVTCAGHTTIATGSYPALHGIISNKWYDRIGHRTMYCMADKNSPVLLAKPQLKKPGGRSPVHINASTVSDEIILAKKGRGFAVSLKDRGAISLAGHAGKAFWFDKMNGGFVSSSWYYKRLPQWVKQWNQNYQPKSVTWQLNKPKENYLFGDAPTFKHRYQAFGQSFPHSTGEPLTPQYYKLLSMTPMADKLTADFAEHLLMEEKLGQTNGQTDYLSVSFSAVDAIGHQFGPNSLEAEDNLLQLDKTLGHFIKQIDQQVGLKNTLILLTADHGVSDTPVYLSGHKIKEVNPLKVPDVTAKIHELLKQRFQLPPSALETVAFPYIYLNKDIISQHQLRLDEVQGYLADALNTYPGIYKAYALPLNENGNGNSLDNKVSRMAYPVRSGDLYLVAPPYQSYGAKSESRVAHGSPWDYDSYVPLLIANPLFENTLISRAVNTTDIAPTITAILMIKPPSAAVGQPLSEIISYYH